MLEENVIRMQEHPNPLPVYPAETTTYHRRATAIEAIGATLLESPHEPAEVLFCPDPLPSSEWMEYMDIDPQATKLQYEGLGSAHEEAVRQKRLALTNGEMLYTPYVPNSWQATPTTSSPTYYKPHYELAPLQVAFELTGQCADEPIEVPSLQNQADFMAIQFEGDGPVTVLPGSVNREFNLIDHVLTTTATYSDAGGTLIEMSMTQFLDYAQSNRGVTRVTLTPRGNCSLKVRGGINGESRPNNHNFADVQCAEFDPEHAITYTATSVSDQQIAFAQRAELSAPHGHLVSERVRKGPQEVWREFELDAQANTPYELTMVVTVAAREAAEPPKAMLHQAALDAAVIAPSYDTIVKEHQEAWLQQWRKAAVTVGGDQEYTRALLFAQGHAIGHVGSKARYPRLEPKILNDVAAGYGGRGFWDGFIFGIKALPQEQRRAMLVELAEFLPAAQHKAQMNNYKGGWFPWEHARPNKEQKNGEWCPPKMPTKNGIFVPVRTYSESIHISADVVYAFMRYVNETNDIELLWKDAGAKVVLESARFLADFATEREPGDFVLEHVTGPDEFHESVTNNAFTLLMTKYALNCAVSLAEGDSAAQERFQALRAEIGLSNEEWAKIQAVSAGLHVPINPQTLVIPAFEGWDSLLTLDFNDPAVKDVKDLDTRMRELYPPPADKSQAELTHHELNPISYFKAIKQDDLLLALVLLQEDLLPLLDDTVAGSLLATYGSPENAMRAVYAANFAEYAPVTINLSSLSPGSAARAAMLAGRPADECYALARKAVMMDLSDQNEYETQQGLHGANAGNAVMLNREGYMGIRAKDGVLSVSPDMPTQLPYAASIEECFGCTSKVVVDNIRGTVMVELLDKRPGKSLRVRVHGIDTVLTPEYPVAYHRGDAVVMMKRARTATVA